MQRGAVHAVADVHRAYEPVAGARHLPGRGALAEYSGALVVQLKLHIGASQRRLAQPVEQLHRDDNIA